DSDLPDDPYLTDRLVTYFPTPLRQRYTDRMHEHRLRREIVTTVVVNGYVNAAGITCFHRLSSETGAPAAEVIRAHIVARAVFGAAGLDAAIAGLDHRVDAGVQTKLRLEVRTLVERGTRWLINNRRRPLDMGQAVAQLSDGVRAVQEQVPALLQGRDKAAYDERRDTYRGAGVPADLAAAVAALPPAYAALTIVQTARRDDLPVEQVARTHFLLGQHLGLDRLLSRIADLPRDDRWQTMARAALRDDLHTAHAALTAEVLAGRPGRPAADAVTDWVRSTPGVEEVARTLRSVCAGRPDLARASVGLRVVRGLLPTIS
ncbi:MAG: NAD-glutamate dehydrogenase, partial [Actinomycetes bacterium]